MDRRIKLKEDLLLIVNAGLLKKPKFYWNFLLFLRHDKSDSENAEKI